MTAGCLLGSICSPLLQFLLLTFQKLKMRRYMSGCVEVKSAGHGGTLPGSEVDVSARVLGGPQGPESGPGSPKGLKWPEMALLGPFSPGVLAGPRTLEKRPKAFPNLKFS